jgi:hypothetical protein
MSKWEKEDRSIYENSEVMMEFEKLILSRCVQLKDIYKKAQESNVKKTTKEVKELGDALDKVRDTAEDIGLGNAVVDEEAEDSNDVKDVESEDITISAKEEVVAELEKLAKDAFEVRNMPLLYKIERTISEILENE